MISYAILNLAMIIGTPGLLYYSTVILTALGLLSYVAIAILDDARF